MPSSTSERSPRTRRAVSRGLTGLVAASLGLSLPVVSAGATEADAFAARVSTRSAPVEDSLGRTWSADRYFDGGYTRAKSVRIDGAVLADEPLYRSARIGMQGYRVPVPADGTYRVTLLFAENWYHQPGRRVFDVRAEGVRKVDDLDVLARVGRHHAYQRQFTVPVTDGRLDLTFPARTGRPMVSALAVETATSGTTSTGTATTSTTSTTTTTTSSDYLVVDRAELLGLPTSGTAYQAMLKVANSSLGVVDLEDQNSTTAGRTLAAALVHARTGSTTHRSKVVTVLKQVPTAPLADAKVLSVGRQLAGYVVAADLVGYRDPAFVSFVRGIRTHDIGNHSQFRSLTQTSERNAANWGQNALASRLAASLYVGDATDVARVVQVFKGFLGDRSAYAGWDHTPDFDATWACSPQAFQPINPASCGDRGGAVVEDISRSAGSYPQVDDTGKMYSWGTLSASMVTARLLDHAGWTGVYDWSDRALLRAGQFLHRKGAYPPDYSVTHYAPWMINNEYGTSLGPVPAAGVGRFFGYTDWLR